MGIFTTQEEAIESYGLRKIEEGIEQGMKRGMERGMERGKKEAIEEAIDVIEVLAKKKGFSIKEFVDICEKSMKERPELLKELQEKNFRNEAKENQEGYSLV